MKAQNFAEIFFKFNSVLRFRFFLSFPPSSFQSEAELPGIFAETRLASKLPKFGLRPIQKRKKKSLQKLKFPQRPKKPDAILHANAGNN